MSVNQHHQRVDEGQQQSSNCNCFCYCLPDNGDEWILNAIFSHICLLILLLILSFLGLEKLLPFDSHSIGFLRNRKLSDNQRHFLEENLQLDKVMTKLLSAMLVDASERKKMEKEVVQKKKIEVLLQIMESKEQEKFDNFLKIIKEVYPAFSQGKAMSVKHKTALISCRDRLVDDLEVSQILSPLYSRGVVDRHDKEAIEAKNTPSEKAEKLLDILPSKPDKAFDIFCDVMRNHKSEYLADVLTEASMRSCDSNTTASPSVNPVYIPSASRVRGEECLADRGKKNTRAQSKQKKNEFLLDKLRSKINKTFLAFVDAWKRVRRSLRTASKVKTEESVEERPAKKFPIFASRKCAENTSSKSVPELPAIAQTKWIVTHLGTQISLNQAFASLKIVCDVSYLEGKQLQKGDMTDLLKNLDSDTFQKFLENLKRNADDVNSNCPKFAESITH